MLSLDSSGRRLALTLGAVLVAGAASSQEPFQKPGEAQHYARYGEPTPASVWEIAAGRYRGDAVRTTGVLSLFEGRSAYLRLTDRNSDLLLLTTDELRAEATSFVGLRVEVVGVPRALVDNQGTCVFLGKQVPQSVCDDPLLPALPDLGPMRAHWPRTSITIWQIVDATPLGSRKRSQEEESDVSLAALLGGEAPPDTVRVRGRFCGRGLCGGLETRAPEDEAWVLEQSGASVWVVGKQPRGKGWRLDSGDRGDTTRWLEVTGRLQACAGGVPCLKAERVLLVRGPDSPNAKDEPRPAGP